MTERIAAAAIDDLAHGPISVDIQDERFILHRTDSDVVAYRNVCPHQLGPVADGVLDVDRGTITCPWHGWAFDLDSGGNCFDVDAGRELLRIATEVEDGTVYLVP